MTNPRPLLLIVLLLGLVQYFYLAGVCIVHAAHSLALSIPCTTIQTAQIALTQGWCLACSGVSWHEQLVQEQSIGQAHTHYVCVYGTLPTQSMGLLICYLSRCWQYHRRSPNLSTGNSQL